MKHLIIHTSGVVEVTEDLNDSIIERSNNGEFNIICINGNQPQQRLESSWRGINSFEE